MKATKRKGSGGAGERRRGDKASGTDWGHELFINSSDGQIRGKNEERWSERERERKKEKGGGGRGVEEEARLKAEEGEE